MAVLGTAYLLGLSVAAVLGPINILAIRTGLQRGFRAAFLVGLGATAADAFYALLAALGAAALVGRAGVRILLWLLGSGMLETVTAGLALRLVAGVAAGTFTWFTALAAALQVGRRLVTPTALRGISVASSVILLGFAAWFGWQALRGLTG